MDATADRGASDARRRAADRYGTADLQEVLSDAEAPRDPTFADWAARGVRVETTPTPYQGDELPDSSNQRVYAATTVLRTAVARDGAREELSAASVVCTLDLGRDGWLVDRIDLTLAP